MVWDGEGLVGGLKVSLSDPIGVQTSPQLPPLVPKPFNSVSHNLLDVNAHDITSAADQQVA